MATGSRATRVTAIIPARGGSKSIPLKNIKPLVGRPLICWALDAVASSPLVDEVIVSTDAPAIADVVQRYRSEKVRVFWRSPETATDEASTESALLEIARDLESEVIVLVQATSPLLRESDVTEALRKYLESGADSLLSVVRQKRFLWEKSPSGAKPLNYDPARRPRRQEFEGVFVENGALYITRREALLASGCRISGRIELYEMPAETYIELDEPSDWPIVEMLLERQLRSARKRTTDIKLVAMDVDGVLTDAGMYYSEAGDELKKFNTKDGHGIARLKSAGLKTAVITGEKTAIVERRAKKLGIDYVFMGVSDKVSVLRELCEILGLHISQVAYIGDDLNDIAALQIVGLSACPRDAIEEVIRVVDYVCQAEGGNGCVREFCEYILRHII